MHIEDERKTLEFKTKPVLSLYLDDERADYKSGCSILELSFPEPATIEEIRFRNSYTAYIKIICKRVPAEKDVKNRDILPWQTSVRHFNLMLEPECEKNSQNLFSLPAKESLIPWTGVVSMRIVLKQPSFRWKKFGIEELTVFGDSVKDGRQSSASHSASSSRRFENKTNIIEQEKNESLSPKSKYAWTITDLVKDKETTAAAVGRFEVDGSYDIAHLV